ncbi:MAG: hypothetical protein JOZ32_15865 [Bryobacterales bacterium]|nr:hypothetical protein [Bryobacterales bacterium]
MKARIQLRQAVVLSLLVCALAAGGVYWFRSRRNAGTANLIAYLPAANASVIYIDVNAIRRVGILQALTGSKASEEPDYLQFVRETKFDYRRDLDGVAAALKDGRIYFALSGRFHWKDLRDYAVRQGGSCHDDFCVVAGSRPDRRISFYALRPGVMAMAISPDDFAAYQVTGKVSDQAAKLTLAPSREPVWALIPAAALDRMDSLPAAAKAYVPALQGAEQIVFSISASGSGSSGGSGGDPQLKLGVHVTCKDAAAASLLLAQLEGTTKTLRELLAHERRQTDPADLSGVLTAGAFRRNEQQVYGVWPIPRAFMDAITASGY